MGKLVRDGIPKLIRASGGEPNIHILDDESYSNALHRKLFEEAEELGAAVGNDRLQELADIYEVLLAISKLYGIDFADIVQAADLKRQERGGFGSRLFLESPPSSDRSDVASVQFAQKAFIEASGNLLCVRKSQSDPFEAGLWDIPGGRILQREDLDAAIQREVWEESGLKIQPRAPFHVWSWYFPGEANHGARVVAIARTCTPLSLETCEDYRVDGDHLGELRWVPLAKIEKLPLIPTLVPVVRKYVTQRQRA